MNDDDTAPPARPPTDTVPPSRPPRPGLARTRGFPLVVTRTTRLVRSTDARWRALFELADTVSEGAVRDEGERRVWYGSTSLILPLGPLAADERDLVVAVAAHDVHVRLRALRAAQREARLRAPAELGVSTCEVLFVADPAGLRIDVDLEAPLIERRAGSLEPRS